MHPSVFLLSTAVFVTETADPGNCDRQRTADAATRGQALAANEQTTALPDGMEGTPMTPEPALTGQASFSIAFSSHITPLPVRSEISAMPPLIWRGSLMIGFHQSAYSSQ